MKESIFGTVNGTALTSALPQGIRSSPPDVLQWMMGSMEATYSNNEILRLATPVNGMTKRIGTVVRSLSETKQHMTPDECDLRARQAVVALVNHGITKKTLRIIAPAPALLLCSALALCREGGASSMLMSSTNGSLLSPTNNNSSNTASSSSTTTNTANTTNNNTNTTNNNSNSNSNGNRWIPSVEAFTLIGRPDLAANLESIAEHSSISQSLSTTSLTRSGSADGITSDSDGTSRLLSLSSLRFGRDRRMQEVIRLLISSRPNRVVVDRQPEDSDHDVERKKQSTLLLLCRRTAALPLGRGMLTLSIDGNERLMHEVLPMPTINLSGRVRKKRRCEQM